VKIIAAEVFVTSPSRNFVTLRITTEDGVTGIGDATLNGRELAVAAYLKEHVAQLLIGKDPHRIEDTWQFLYRSSYWRRGPVTMAAIAAVDMALWDIKGKIAGMPVYQLLGGASRNGLRAYGHASGADLPSLFDSVREHLELGYKSIRIQTGTTTNPPAVVPSLWRRTGTPARTCATCPPCSRPSGTNSARRSRCCTTATTA
jgi:mannonate dehydratase